LIDLRQLLGWLIYDNFLVDRFTPISFLIDLKPFMSLFFLNLQGENLRKGNRAAGQIQVHVC
jgi:hypothetical protein